MRREWSEIVIMSSEKTLSALGLLLKRIIPLRSRRSNDFLQQTKVSSMQLPYGVATGLRGRRQVLVRAVLMGRGAVSEAIQVKITS